MSQLYWATGGYTHAKHSIIVPLELLTALVVVQPHLGGAIQQDVADALRFFDLHSTMGVPLAQDAESFCSNGVVQAALPASVLEGHDILLAVLLEMALPREQMWSPKFVYCVEPANGVCAQW